MRNVKSLTGSTLVHFEESDINASAPYPGVGVIVMDDDLENLKVKSSRIRAIPNIFQLQLNGEEVAKVHFKEGVGYAYVHWDNDNKTAKRKSDYIACAMDLARGISQARKRRLLSDIALNEQGEIRVALTGKVSTVVELPCGSKIYHY